VRLAGAASAPVAEFADGAGIDGLDAGAALGTDDDGRPTVTVHVTAPAPSVFLQLLRVVPHRMESEASATVTRLGPG
jgi:hypothetical protein